MIPSKCSGRLNLPENSTFSSRHGARHGEAQTAHRFADNFLFVALPRRTSRDALPVPFTRIVGGSKEHGRSRPLLRGIHSSHLRFQPL
mmetsp:Transcript_63358/g.112219  ORF Transcript_63358/g.112219 Transcript_63358/m.112219 type:complete len:88 (+) Transcript_63358:393-656(+)